MFWNLFKKRYKPQQSNGENTPDETKPEEDLNNTEKEILENELLYADESQKPNPEYIKTIFLLLFQKHPYRAEDSFPTYFQYEFEVIHMPTFFNEVLNEGLLTPASSDATLSMLKVSDLKSILEENNLKKSGNKTDLVQRIIENVDFSNLPIMQQNFYSLSHDGEAFLENHKDYIKLRQHSEWGIGFWEYQNAKDSSCGLLGFNDIILSLLHDKIKLIKKRKHNMNKYEYSRLHELYLSIYRLYNEDANYSSALKALLSSALLSVSCCENFWLIEYKWGLKLNNTQVLLYYKPIYISPYTASEIRALQEYYTVDISKNVYDRFIGPYNFCTFEMFCEIIDEIFSVSTLDLSPYDYAIKPLFIKKLNKPRNY